MHSALKNHRALAPVVLLISIVSLLQRPASAEIKSYVVYLGAHSHGREGAALAANQERARSSHYQFLGSVLGSEEKAQDAIFYSYTKYINGFAATLEEEDAMEISSTSVFFFSQHPSVISVFPNRGRKLHTTRSWEFLGMEKDGRVRANSIWAKAKLGEGIIIGNLDTGVWPEAGSFSDDGMGPAPARWRGVCHDQSSDAQVRCNRKLIGAQYFNKGYMATVGQANPASTRDSDGHGTHTLSTAAGRFVPGANLFGYGNGTAKGGAPGAHVAAYKVCWRPVNGSECFDADIIAAFDAAIHDGVDVLSVSLGGAPAEYFNDGVAIGSFHAVRNGVTVVCSAGNSGPGAGTVSNTAPWLVTVGASTVDREFPAYLVLGNKKRIKGQSLSPVPLAANKHYQLIGSEEAKAANATVAQAQLCIQGSLDKTKVKGKIVVCMRGKNARVEKGETVHRAGGVGLVLANDEATGNEMIADAHVLPATHITYSDGVALLAYVNSNRLASGYITVPSTALETKPAPFMAAFSSQGPNTVTPQILKPDITAPGVSILAAFTGLAGPTGLAFDSRRVLFNSESGTSMSCPHVAGIAGLLKALHPDWSPAAIKSAIMTTARVRDNTKQPMRNSSFLPATPFGYGAGHVQPNRAADPGLVYDMGAADYLRFLCALGYNSSVIGTFMGGQPDDSDRQNTTPLYACPAMPPKVEDLNYPSVAVPHVSPSGEPRTVTRRVRNVGAAPAVYDVRVHEPRGVSVSVRPSRLEFAAAGEEKEFAVTFRAKEGSFLPGEYVFGRMVWADGAGRHRVRSPLVARVADHHRTNKTGISVA
ncbi:hypothetical protein ACQ4PT_063982 [Festuca glaucescens]